METVEERLDQANRLKSQGDLHLREKDLARARACYEPALRLFCELEDRLGEAHCLQSLGDLYLQASDMAGARSRYEMALLLYREIQHRPGEASSLQGLGRLEMGEVNFVRAFNTFRQLLELYRELGERQGIAICLDYLARAAAATSQDDQAIVLAELALQASRSDVDDLSSRALNLELQVFIFRKTRDLEAALGTMKVHRSLAEKMKDKKRLAQFTPHLKALLSTLSAEKRQTLENDPEALRRAGVERAAARLEAKGRDPLTPLAETP